jgi:uncharacterized membrane protein HdeD (DUF308 family)
MSDIASASGHPHRHLAPRSGWFVALGVVMVLAGIFALADTVLVTLLSVIVIGAAMVVGGLVQIVHAFANKDWRAFVFALLCGALYIVGGTLVMAEPVQGSLLVTVLLLAALSVNGVLRIAMALRHREVGGWWLLLLTGLVSVGLALLLFLGLPWSSLWLLGTIVAVELICHGIAWIGLGFGLRALR